MKITNKKVGAFGFFAAILLAPMLVYGASLIPCGQPAGTPNLVLGGTSYVTTNPCGFNDLIILVNVIIHFLMYDVAVPLAAIGFMVVGGRLVLNQDKEGAWSAAKEGFTNIAIGFFIMLGAYIFIKTVLFMIVSDEQKSFMQFLFQ